MSLLEKLDQEKPTDAVQREVTKLREYEKLGFIGK